MTSIGATTKRAEVAAPVPNPVSAAAGAPGRAKVGYLPTLDGWRAVAIGLVLWSHGHDALAAFTGGRSVGLDGIMPNPGTFGVRIFFGISGFLICTRLIEEQSARGRINLGGFYTRRAFRILPPLLAFLLAVLALGVAGVVPVSKVQWLAGLAFAGNYIRGDYSYYLAHLWSLAVEEHFYLVVPGLLVLVGMRRGLGLMAGLAVVVAGWRAVAFWMSAGQPGFSNDYFMKRTDIIADGLLWGCAAAFGFASVAGRRWLRAVSRPWIWWPLTALLFASPGLLALAEPNGKTRMAVLSVQAIAIPLVLCGTVLRSESAVGRALEWSPLRWIGRLSYSLYLWQQLFFVGDSHVAPGLAALQRFPVNLAAALACALASYYLIERPAMRLGHRLARPVTAGRPELAAARG